MTVYSRGDIVLVPFDFTDRSGSKVRPAIVVSSDEYNRKSPDVLIASLTGNLSAIRHEGNRLVLDWEQAGLLAPSLFQTKLATLENMLVRRKLGRVSHQDWERIEDGLRSALDLPWADVDEIADRLKTIEEQLEGGANPEPPRKS